MRYTRPIIYLVLVFVSSNLFLLLTSIQRGFPLRKVGMTDKRWIRPETDTSDNKIKNPQNETPTTVKRFSEIIAPSNKSHDYRSDIRIIKKQKIRYPAFTVTEPNFINEEGKVLFYKLKENKDRIGVPSNDKLLGEIITVRNGTYAMPHDCGYRSNISHVLERRDKLPGGWFRALVPMMVPDAGTFQHFLDGTLPKIIQALDYIKQPTVKLLLPKIRDAIIYDILEKLNISREKIVVYNGSVGADYLVYTCVTPPIHPFLWQRARSLLGVPVNLSSTKKTKIKIVIITRKGCFNCGRVLLNEEELLASLKKKYNQSNVIAFRGPMDLTESIRLFGDAKVVIGVHSGGLYNINFCPSNTTVIEIMPTRSNGTFIAAAHQIFWTQSVLLNHQYWRLPTEPVNDMGDVNVNITLVENILDKL